MSNNGAILIIDDEITLRQTLARILQQDGFSATTAENGEQGLILLENNTFNLVFMDIRMPGLPGLDVLEKIRNQHPNLPVILFTAQPDINSAVEALRRGATDYLLKPLKPETILERARTIISNQRKEQRRREIQAQIAELQAELAALESGANQPESAPASSSKTTDRYLQRGNLVFDSYTRRLSIGEQVISLVPTSFDFLLVLARHAPQVVSYQTLVAEAQGYQVDSREAQELTKWHIHNIRQAIEPDSRNPRYVFNIRGVGYRLVTD